MKKIFVLIIFVLLLLPSKILAFELEDCSNEKCSYEAAVIIGENPQYYNTLKEAIDSASFDVETTIYLVDDVYLTENISISKKIVIDGRNKYKITRSSEYTGGFFKVLLGTDSIRNKLSLKDVTLDAGAKWAINDSKIKEIEETIPMVASSAVATDYYKLDSGSISSSDTLLHIDSYSDLELLNTNIVNYMSDSSIMFSISSLAEVYLKENSSIQNNLLIGNGKLAEVAGSFVLEDNSSIKDNLVISNGSYSLMKVSSGKMALNDNSSIKDNTIINAAYMVYMTGSARVVINEEKENASTTLAGAIISNNKLYPGPNTSLSTMFYNYNSNSGSIIMNAGEISNNIGGTRVLLDQRRPLNVLNFNGGIIKNNKSVYDTGYIIGMRGSDVGKNMIIEDSVYIKLGSTDDLHYFNNAGIMSGEIFIDELNGLFNNTGVINNDVIIDGSYSGKTTINGKINGNVIVRKDANALIEGVVDGDVILQENSKLDISGTVKGNVYVDMSTIDLEESLIGDGTIEGFLIFKYVGDKVPSEYEPSLNIKKKIIKYNADKELLVEFLYEDESNDFETIPKESENDILSSIEKQGYDLSNLYVDEDKTNLWQGDAESSHIKLYVKKDEPVQENPSTLDFVSIVLIVMIISIGGFIVSSLVKKDRYYNNC